MRSFFTLLWILCGLSVNSQTLESAEVEMKWQGQYMEVRETLSFAFGGNDPAITLKALQRSGAKITEVSLLENDQPLVFEKIVERGLLQIEASPSPKNGNGEVIVTYQITCDSRAMDLPLFFTGFAAGSPEDDFFTMTIAVPETVKPFVHFPTVEMVESTSGVNQMLSFELPALPSMIRMDLLALDESTPIYTQVADGLVLAIFILASALIWTNRKRLFYG